MVSKRKTDARNSTALKKQKAEDEAALKAGLQLRVHPDPPEYPFLNHYFDMDVFLIEGSKESKKCGLELPLQFGLVFDETNKPITETLTGKPVIETDPPAPCIDQTGQTRVRVMLRELSMDRENKKFRVVVRAKTSEATLNVQPVFSRPIHVIRYRLQLVDQPPEIWYKDQGGRENCIELRVNLLNHDLKLVKGHEVPLRVSLQYEDGASVLNHHTILKCLPEKLSIQADGTAHLRIRIEDVSKNHQSKSFVIRVEPDTQQSPVHFDVAPDLSQPVQVRSKLNKKAKQKQSSIAGRAGGSKTSATSRGLGGQRKSANDVGAAPLPTTSRGPVNPASILPPRASYAPSGPNAAAVKAAMWCDHVKDALFQLQATALQRTAIESHLFALLSQYDTIRSFIKPQVGEVKSEVDGQNNGLLAESSSTQRRIAARPVLAPTESFTMLKNQFSLGQSLGIQMLPFFTGVSQAGGMLPGQSMGAPFDLQAAQQQAALLQQRSKQGGESSSATGNGGQQLKTDASKAGSGSSFQEQISVPAVPDFSRLNSLFLPDQVFGSTSTSTVPGVIPPSKSTPDSRYMQDYDDDEDECEDSKVHYLLERPVGSNFRSGSEMSTVLQPGDGHNLGFPAFDKEGILVGFYFPQETGGHSTIGFKTKGDVIKDGKVQESTFGEIEQAFIMERTLPNYGLLSSVESCTPSTGYHLAEKVISMVKKGARE